jgi:membrane protein
MLKTWAARIKRAIVEVRDFLDEKTVGSANHDQFPWLRRFAHFWLMVGKSFSRNRCPIRAAALAYTTLLALIPMLAVILSIVTGVLRQEGGEEHVQRNVARFIDKLVANITPPGTSSTNTPSMNEPATNALSVAMQDAATNVLAFSETNDVGANAPTNSATYVAARQQVADTINGLIKKTNSRAIGGIGTALLIFAAISMLSRVEATFNDIWGVAKGRNWLHTIVQYWAVITLVPVLVALAVGLENEPQLNFARSMLHSHVAALLLHGARIAVLGLSFALFYMFMPNTYVPWRAAMIGGLVGGILWHLNSVLSVLYVSRWVSNSKLYGGLAAIPVVMVGLYFSWLILLFGAQVAYGWQHRRAYRQDKQAENINQRGREFIALRLMQCVGRRFLHGERPATVLEMADALVVPSRLVQQIMQTLLAAGLIVEVAGKETAYSPARTLEKINCHHILLALRAGQGQELATRDDPARAEVFGEFEKILEAERKAASGVTVLTMVNRADELTALAGKQPAGLPEGKVPTI